MRVQIRSRGPSSTKLRFAPGVPGPATEWRVNEATTRFEYRPQRSDGVWTEAPGSELDGLIANLTPEQMLVTQDASGAIDRSVADKATETVSVKDFGAIGDGLPHTVQEWIIPGARGRYVNLAALQVDYPFVTGLTYCLETAAFNAAWAEVKARRNARGTVAYRIIVPPAEYDIRGSINWTGYPTVTYLGWNTHIEAHGAVLLGNCTGKAVVDMTGIRGVHLHGLTIWGSTTNIPSCAILLGNRNIESTGNNRFDNIKTVGYFSKAALWNIGSETTQYYFSYFINENPSATAWAALLDGCNRYGATSDYSPIRAVGQGVSYTNNRFVGCRFQKNVTGSAVFMELTTGWTFDRDCYFLAFDQSAVVMRNGTTWRNQALRLSGLFETTQGFGLKHCVTIVVPDGEFTALSDCYFDIGQPHAHTSMIRVVRESDYGPMTSGSVQIRAGQLNCSGFYGTTPVPLFEGAFISFTGEIRCADARQINLSTLTEFSGMVYTSDWDDMTVPATATGFIIDRTHGTRLMSSLYVSGDVSAIGAARRLRRSGVTWAASQTIVYGDVRFNGDTHRAYRCTNVGGTTVDKPVHTTGSVTGSDGIAWQNMYVQDDHTIALAELENDGFRIRHRVLHEVMELPGSYVQEITGQGSPEGRVAAPVGSRYFRTNGGTNSVFYVKEGGGSGNTGWVAK